MDRIVALNNEGVAILQGGHFTTAVQNFRNALQHLSAIAAQESSIPACVHGSQPSEKTSPPRFTLSFKALMPMPSPTGSFVYNRVAWVSTESMTFTEEVQRKLGAVVTYNMALAVQYRRLSGGWVAPQCLALYKMSHTLLASAMNDGAKDQSMDQLILATSNNLGVLLVETGAREQSKKYFLQITEAIAIEHGKANDGSSNTLPDDFCSELELNATTVLVLNPSNTASAA